MPRKNHFSKGEVAEIKELYDGTFGSVRELAKLFNCSNERIRWAVNHKNYKGKQTATMKRWYSKNRKMANQKSKDYYYRNKSRNK